MPDKLWYIYVIIGISFLKTHGQYTPSLFSLQFHCLGGSATVPHPEDVSGLFGLLEDSAGENCNYYKLVLKNVIVLFHDLGWNFTDDQWKNTTLFPETEKLLKSAPPPGNTIHISIQNIETFFYYQSEWSQKITMGLIVKASWIDTRLAWDTIPAYFTPHQRSWYDDSYLPNPLRIHPKDIWHPDFAHSEATQYISENYIEHEGKIYKNGTVEMSLIMMLHGQSPMNYDGFPNDKHDACVQLLSYKYNDMITYDLNTKIVGKRSTGRWNMFPAWWKLIGSSVEQNPNEGVVNICLKLQRYSTIYIYKLVLPLAACTFLAVVIPIFSGWKLQIAAKFLALVLTFFSVMFTDKWEAAFGPNVPRFIKVYDFLIWSTITSVSFTVVLWGLSMQKFFKPAPHMLVLITNLINPLFCWTNPTGDNYVSFGGIGGDSEKGDKNPVKNVKDYSKEWSSIFLGINNILLLIYSAIYVIGLIVCAV